MRQLIVFILIYINTFIKCLECINGQGINTYNQQCFSCLNNCNSCQIGQQSIGQPFTEQYQKCSQCQKPYLLNQDQNSCVKECKNSDFQINSQCKTCLIYGCLKCFSSSECIQCQQGFNLINGQCVSSCNQFNKYLNVQQKDCVFQCQIQEIQNEQLSSCQAAIQCPIQKSVSNYCHQYRGEIFQQTIQSFSIFQDIKNQDIIVSYDTIGNIKFWLFQSPIINFISEISASLLNPDPNLLQQFYYCIYSNYIQYFDLKSNQVNEIRALQQSTNGLLIFIDQVDFNSQDFICLVSEQKVIIFELDNIFKNNQTSPLFEIDALSSNLIVIIQFTQELLIYKSEEKWAEQGNFYQGVLYRNTQMICKLKYQYTQIKRATLNIYLLLGFNTFCTIIINQNSITQCSENIIPNIDTSQFYIDFVSSNNYLVVLAVNYKYYINRIALQVINIQQNSQGEITLTKISQFQGNMQVQYQNIQDKYLIYADYYIAYFLYKLDLTTFTMESYYIKETFYSIHIIDSYIILTTYENNFFQLQLNGNGNYLKPKQTICKTQRPIDSTVGMYATTIIKQNKKYYLSGFFGHSILRTVNNSQIIANIQIGYLILPFYNEQLNKLYIFKPQQLVVIDLTKNQENENEFISQLIIPQLQVYSYPFYDDQENFYVYSFGQTNQSYIINFQINGNLIKLMPVRQDLNYSTRFLFFSKQQKVVCLIDETSCILSFFDFINFTTLDIKLTDNQIQQIQQILFATQIDSEQILIITQNLSFLINFQGNIIQTTYLLFQNNQIILFDFKLLSVVVVFQNNIIQFIDYKLNILPLQYSTYGVLLDYAQIGKFLFVSYDSKQIQAIDFSNQIQTVFQVFQRVNRIIQFPDDNHFGIFVGKYLQVYSIEDKLEIRKSFTILLPTNTCETIADIQPSAQYTGSILKDKSGICSIIGQSGITSSQIQLKIPGQMYLNAMATINSNQTIISSSIDQSLNKIYLVLKNSLNQLFFSSINYKKQLQVKIEINENILLISNISCQWFVFQLSSGQLLYNMPSDKSYNKDLQCTYQFDKVNQKILLKQTKQIVSFSYSQNSTNWFLTTSQLGNTYMVGLYQIDDLNIFMLITNPCIAVIYDAPYFLVFKTYVTIFVTQTFVQMFYDKFNQRIIFCSQDYSQCNIYSSSFQLIKSISFINQIDLSQTIFIDFPINTIVAPNNQFQIQIMYLGDEYQQSQQVQIVDLSSYTEELESYNQQILFLIIEDFQKDILIVGFCDYLFFIKISQMQVIQLINHRNNLNENQNDGYISSLNLDKITNILTVVTQTSVIIYDYSSICFYDPQDFYVLINDGNMIDSLLLTDTNKQINYIIAFTNEFLYNQLSFYKVSLQYSKITPQRQIDLTQQSQVKFPQYGGTLQNSGDASNQVNFKIRTMVINQTNQYLLIQYHILRYNLYIVNENDVILMKQFFFVSSEYIFYTLLEEYSNFPVLFLQSKQAISIQILNEISQQVVIKQMSFNNTIDDCDIRYQIIYCVCYQGKFYLSIDLKNPQNISLQNLELLNQLTGYQSFKFSQKLNNNFSNYPLIFKLNDTIFCWNLNNNTIEQYKQTQIIQQIYLGQQYILVQLRNLFDLQIFPLDANGKFMQSSYYIQQPVQQTMDIPSNLGIPLYFNTKLEQTEITEQYSQYIVLKTFSQVNIYQLADFSLYLTIRQSNITNIQNIKIIHKSVFLLVTKVSIQTYFFSKKYFYLLQSLQVQKPLIGYSQILPLQQKNLYQISLVISQQYEISLIQYNILLYDYQSNQNNKQSALQCVYSFSNYTQDLSLLNYQKEIQSLQQQFIVTGYADLKVIQVYFAPQSALYFRNDLFQPLIKSNFILRIYSDSPESKIFLFNYEQGGYDKVYIEGCSQLEIQNMTLSVPNLDKIKQPEFSITIYFNSNFQLQNLKMLNVKLNLDEQVSFVLQNISLVAIQNLEITIQNHSIQNTTIQNDSLMLISNIQTVYIDTILIQNVNIIDSEYTVQNFVSFVNIQELVISNLKIIGSNINLSSILRFQNVQNITLNNTILQDTKLIGKFYSVRNSSFFVLSSLQILDCNFKGDEYQIIQMIGVSNIVIDSFVMTNSSAPALLQVQEQIDFNIIQITSQLQMKDIIIQECSFKDINQPSIYLSSIQFTCDNLKLQSNYYKSNAIQIFSSMINITNSDIQKNIIIETLLSINIFQQNDLLKINQIVYFFNNQFKSNNLQNGQVLYLVNQNNIMIIQCKFMNNTLSQSFQGSSTFDSSKNIIILNSTFFQNKVIKGCGGAIYFINSQMTIKETQITDNEAIIGGGIRYQGLTSSLIIDKNNTISQNRALLFGQDITSYPQQIKFEKDYQYLFSQLVSGSLLSEPIIFHLIDQFNETIHYPINQQINQVHQEIIDEYDNYIVILQNINTQFLHIQGSIIVYDNYLSFQPQITSIPSSKQYLSFQLTKSVPIYNTQTNSFTNDIIKSTIELMFLECQSGQIPKEEFNLVSCYSCPNGTYSFFSKFQRDEVYSCNHCPAGASYCEKDIIILQDGYWRTSQFSEQIFQCQNSNNCIQTSNKQKYNISLLISIQEFQKSICLEGRLGALCDSCDINGDLWDHRYSLSNDNLTQNRYSETDDDMQQFVSSNLIFNMRKEQNNLLKSESKKKSIIYNNAQSNKLVLQMSSFKELTKSQQSNRSKRFKLLRYDKEDNFFEESIKINSPYYRYTKGQQKNITQSQTIETNEDIFCTIQNKQSEDS
ncbi:hypothetical protein ABPG73_018139 [Tetrahymena malaccensis]